MESFMMAIQKRLSPDVWVRAFYVVLKKLAYFNFMLWSAF